MLSLMSDTQDTETELDDRARYDVISAGGLVLEKNVYRYQVNEQGLLVIFGNDEGSEIIHSIYPHGSWSKVINTYQKRDDS